MLWAAPFTRQGPRYKPHAHVQSTMQHIAHMHVQSQQAAPSGSVDVVPLSAITDLSLRCTIPGRILGYGALRIETAGQNRALERLNFLPSLSAVYGAMLR